MWKPKSRAFAQTKFYDHAPSSIAHGLPSEHIFVFDCFEMAMFEEQYLSNQSELGHGGLRVWKRCREKLVFIGTCSVTTWELLHVPNFKSLCHHSKYSLRGGQTESRLGKHGKIPYTSTSRRTSAWNTPCYPKPLWHTVLHRGMKTRFMKTILIRASVSPRKMKTLLLGSWWPWQCVLPTLYCIESRPNLELASVNCESWITKNRGACALTRAGGSFYTIKLKSACRKPDLPRWWSCCLLFLPETNFV